jgi:hypothetical protein
MVRAVSGSMEREAARAARAAEEEEAGDEDVGESSQDTRRHNLRHRPARHSNAAVIGCTWNSQRCKWCMWEKMGRKRLHRCVLCIEDSTDCPGAHVWQRLSLVPSDSRLGCSSSDFSGGW